MNNTVAMPKPTEQMQIAVDWFAGRYPETFSLAPVLWGTKAMFAHGSVELSASSRLTFLEHVEIIAHEFEHAAQAARGDTWEVAKPLPSTDHAGYWNHPSEVGARAAGLRAIADYLSPLSESERRQVKITGRKLVAA